MRYPLAIVLVLAGLSSCTTPKMPIGFWSNQRYDAALQPHGPWRQYHPGPPARVSIRQRFRHGRAVGRWRFYSPDGVKERIEKYNGESPILITYFHPNGRVMRKGQARVVTEPAGYHFFWFGEWPSYSAAGKLLKVELYEDGKLIGVKKKEMQAEGQPR